MTKNRINWIDFGKGFAIFLVVIGHVFTGLFDSGKFTSDAKWLSIVIAFIYISIFQYSLLYQDIFSNL